jgi:hypothetical protein
MNPRGLIKANEINVLERFPGETVLVSIAAPLPGEPYG